MANIRQLLHCEDCNLNCGEEKRLYNIHRLMCPRLNTTEDLKAIKTYQTITMHQLVVFFLQQRMSKDFSFGRFLGLPILNEFSFYGKATIEEN